MTDYTGYIRYTDVQYKWYLSLINVYDSLRVPIQHERKNSVPKTPEGANPLAALLSLNALIHPSHPLRLKGDDGIRLYIAIIKSEDKIRLLFSTAQLQYMQYWLYAMGFTESPIPLPSSKYIIKESDVDRVENRIYNNEKELKKADSAVRKLSRTLLGLEASVKQAYTTFETGRSWWNQDENGTWLAIDFEEWERDHSALLEFGWSMRRVVKGKVKGDKNEDDWETGHVIMKGMEGYHNGTYVPDQRNRFGFGSSQRKTRSELKQFVQEMFTNALSDGPLFLIFHSHYSDIRTLRSLDAPLNSIHSGGSEYPPRPEKGMIYLFDTQRLFTALEGSSQPKKLSEVCRLLKVDMPIQAPVHNAGNDAHYTLQALKEMLGHEEIGQQQRRRWPEKTPNKGKLQFEKHEYVDSDYDGSDYY